MGSKKMGGKKGYLDGKKTASRVTIRGNESPRISSELDDRHRGRDRGSGAARAAAMAAEANLDPGAAAGVGGVSLEAHYNVDKLPDIRWSWSRGDLPAGRSSAYDL
jgi:hypothetical protein